MRAENCLHIKLSCASIQKFVEHQFARTHQVEHQIAHLVEHEARSNKATKVAVLEVCNMAPVPVPVPVPVPTGDHGGSSCNLLLQQFPREDGRLPGKLLDPSFLLDFVSDEPFTSFLWDLLIKNHLASMPALHVKR